MNANPVFANRFRNRISVSTCHHTATESISDCWIIQTIDALCWLSRTIDFGMGSSPRNIAILIDGDNAQPSLIEHVLAETSQIWGCHDAPHLRRLDSTTDVGLERCAAFTRDPTDTAVPVHDWEKRYGQRT